MTTIQQMIQRFGQVVIVYRSNAGEYNEFGEFTDGEAVAPFPITACVQPVTGRDRELLPEGVKTEETKKLFTTDILNVDSEDSQTKADELVIGLERYKVISCQVHTEGVLNHYKVFVQFIGAES